MKKNIPPRNEAQMVWRERSQGGTLLSPSYLHLWDVALAFLLSAYARISTLIAGNLLSWRPFLDVLSWKPWEKDQEEAN